MSSQKKAIKVGLAGLGFGESVHIPALQANENLNLAAIWHPRESRLLEASKKHSITGYQNWYELLKNKDIQAIIIATPPEPRVKLAFEALNANKHLLLEKPVALNSEELKEIEKLSINKKLSVAIDFEYRAVPIFMQAKRLLENQYIGTPWLIKFDWLMSSRANKEREWNWYSDENQGGGVIGALGTHAFDIIHWLFGPTKSINAITSTSIKQRLKQGSLTEVTSEDTALAQLEIESQASTDLVPTQLTLSATALNGRGCWIEIYGSEGTLVIGSENQKDYVHGFGLWAAKEGETLKSVIPEDDLKFKKTWSDGRIAPVSRLQGWWATSIINGAPIVPGLFEGYSSQLACDKLKESLLFLV